MDIAHGGVSEGELLPLDSPQTPALRVDPRSRELREEIRAKWLRAKKNRTGSAHTVEAYNRDVSTYFEWCDARGFDVFTMFAPDVEGYVDWLLTTDNVGRYKSKVKPRSKSTVARMVTSVSSFYAYARKHTQGQVANPVDLIERPRPDTTESQTLHLSRDEVDRLREVAHERSLREYALVQVLLGTALRVSEVCEADTGDFTTAGDYDVLLVRRKGGKKARVRIPPAAARALRAYLQGRKGPLFLLDNGNRMTRRMVDYHLASMAREAGIRKRISPHSLRHTAATLALKGDPARGIDPAPLRDVQVQLGHARSETTARYDRAARELDNAAADALAAVVEDQ